MHIEVHEYVQIVVDNIKMFIEILRIQNQSVQNLHSQRGSQIFISTCH